MNGLDKIENGWKNPAKRGSGGIGFLVHERVLDKCTVYVLDNECEGILWLKFASQNT